MTQELVIIKRQFKIINQQIVDNYPYETGGFFGGKGNMILGVYPIANMNYGSEAKKTFSISEDDIYYAQRFFKDNNLNIIGMYHSHPNGAAMPSKQDMVHLVGDKFGRHHLIVSIKKHNLLKKKFNVPKDDPAFQVGVGLWYCPSHKEKIQINLKIIENSHIGYYSEQNNISQDFFEEYLRLEEKIYQMIKNGKINYKKEDAHALSKSEFEINT